MEANAGCSRCGLTFLLPADALPVGALCPRCDGEVRAFRKTGWILPDGEELYKPDVVSAVLCMLAVGPAIVMMSFCLGPQVAIPIGMVISGLLLWGLMRVSIRLLVPPAWVLAANIGSALLLATSLLLVVGSLWFGR
jgi:hypothetical protein